MFKKFLFFFTRKKIFFPFSFLLIDYYVLKQYIKILISAFILFTSIFLFADFFTNLRTFLEKLDNSEIRLNIILDYYKNLIPSFFLWSGPISFLFATIYVLDQLYRNKEVISIISSGIHLFRFILPIWILSFLFSIFMVYLSLSFIPKSFQHSQELKSIILQEDRNMNQRNIEFFGKKNIYYFISSFQAENELLKKVIINKIIPENDRFLKSEVLIPDGKDYKLIKTKDLQYLQTGNQIIFKKSNKQKDKVAPPKTLPTENQKDKVAPPKTLPTENQKDKVALPKTLPTENQKDKVALPKTLPTDSQKDKLAPPKTLPTDSQKDKLAPPKTLPTENQKDKVAPPKTLPTDSQKDKLAPPKTLPTENQKDKVAPPKTLPTENQKDKVALPKTLPTENQKDKVAPPKTLPLHIKKFLNDTDTSITEDKKVKIQYLNPSEEDLRANLYPNISLDKEIYKDFDRERVKKVKSFKSNKQENELDQFKDLKKIYLQENEKSKVESSKELKDLFEKSFDKIKTSESSESFEIKKQKRNKSLGEVKEKNRREKKEPEVNSIKIEKGKDTFIYPKSRAEEAYKLKELSSATAKDEKSIKKKNKNIDSFIIPKERPLETLEKFRITKYPDTWEMLYSSINQESPFIDVEIQEKDFNIAIPFYYKRRNPLYYEYRITAEYASWDHRLQKWILYNAYKQVWNKEVNQFRFEKYDEYILYEAEESLETFKKLQTITQRSSNELSFQEGLSMISYLKLARRKWEVLYIDLYAQKLSLPFSTFLITILGSILSKFHSRKLLLLNTLFKASFIFIIYFILFQLGVSFSKITPIMPVIIAPWFGNLFFLIFTIFVLRRVKT